jgi:hypothetical protein
MTKTILNELLNGMVSFGQLRNIGRKAPKAPSETIRCYNKSNYSNKKVSEEFINTTRECLT